MTVERTFGISAGVVLGLAILYYLYGPKLQEKLSAPADEPPVAEAPPPQPAPPPTAPPPAATAPEYPVPAEVAPATEPKKPWVAPKPEDAPPPNIDLVASDPSVRDSIASVFGAALVEQFLVSDRIIQNIVTTVDSLDRDPVPLRFRAIVNVPEVPTVEKRDDLVWLSPKNADRYATLITALQATDARTIASLYIKYYPLLERAYREMGYPDAYFNDRVIHVIDHLLATPKIGEPVQLVQPKVLYQYANPELEQLSSGQKLMIRIGERNAAVVRQRLTELRAILASNKAVRAATAPRREAEPPGPHTTPAAQ